MSDFDPVLCREAMAAASDKTAKATAMTIDAGRLWRRLEALSRITDPARPWTRRSFTPLFLQGRDWLISEFRAAGLDVSIDAAGNLIGRLEGSHPGLKPILIGSHSDTVPSGGRYDGPLGILAALEVAQAFIQCGERPRHPLEICDFLAEEPSEFGLSCIGSRALSGTLTEAALDLSRPDGMTLGEAIAFAGGRPDALDAAKRDAAGIAAFVEVHIEQGRVLEDGGIPIGIVTDIVGIHRERITVTGRADHAGATPMHLRADALVGAARIIEAAHGRAVALCNAGTAIVATIGKLDVTPNAANAVPGQVEMILEVRCADEALTRSFGHALVADEALAAALASLGLTLAMQEISHAAPAPCAPVVREAIGAAAMSLGLATKDLPSGAGHDGAFISRLGPYGMIFVPCRDGRSHTPEESIEPHQAADGARVLLETVLRLDRALD